MICKHCMYRKPIDGMMACIFRPSSPMYTSENSGCDFGAPKDERRDVYVVLSETPDDGSVIAAVYSKLDDALTHVRNEWSEYRKREDRGAIEWNNPAACGHYGWYDTDASFGCYVYARELKEEFA